MSATLECSDIAGHGLLLSGDRYGLIGEADRRFRRLLLRVGLPMLLFAIIVPWLRFEPPPKLEIAAPPVRSVELLPEPVRPKVELPPVARPLPKALAATKSAAAAAPAMKVEAEVRPDPRQQAAAAGLLRLREQLAAINERSLVSINSPQALVAGSRNSSGSSPTLSAATSSAGAGGTATRGVAGQGRGADLGARRTGQVQGGVSGSGAGAVRGNEAGGAGRGGRGLEDLQLGFDRSKSSLNAIFSRSARESVGLGTGMGAGRIVVSLTIAPDGSVSRCELVSSSFANPALEQKLLARIRQMNFGARDVPSFSYPNYPIDFLPT